MYLVLIACQVLLLSVTSANPFHKYPYVFLLDIGNEELEKTNSEQIRVNVPGGSLALRYPGVGNGDTITHVRVSGIDFGTDLQANVVDGGPGSKYVVIVFAGNQGTPYDAVITVQTISDEDMSQSNIANLANNNKVEDNNDSAEDLSNDDSTDLKAGPGDESVIQSDSQGAGNTYAEIRQPSYSYGNSEGDSGNANEEIRQNSYNSYSSYKNSDDYDNTNDEGTSDNDQQTNEDDQDEEENDELDQEDNQAEVNYKRGNIQDSQVEQQHADFNDDYGNEDNETPYNADESSKYSKYQSIMPKLYDGVRIYPQNAVPFVLSSADNSVYNSEDPNEVDQTFNDEENHNNYKNKDTNNNFYDSDDASAVES
ncbi:protein PFC0760c-like [Ostrinia furnacalis]|uniref:protein PFC0760c-like n=1 Tax=Ostrinia furnacalis TaxID=93504 RepID=UPI001039AB17|nr:protein PFC0760c-like [Ostrinia furnacalis]